MHKGYIAGNARGDERKYNPVNKITWTKIKCQYWSFKFVV